MRLFLLPCAALGLEAHPGRDAHGNLAVQLVLLGCAGLCVSARSGKR